jgi:hypothetical protein
MGFSIINDAECAVLRALALLADDRLPATVEELVWPPTQPVSTNALRTLHVAMALLAHKLKTGDAGTGKWASVNALWAQQKHGLPLHLLVILDVLTADAQAYFSLIPPPPQPTSSSHAELACLLAGADELLQVLAHLLLTHSLPTRAVNGLINTTVDLFTFADAADTLNSVRVRGTGATCDVH